MTHPVYIRQGITCDWKKYSRQKFQPLSNVYRTTSEPLSNICRIVFNDSWITSNIFYRNVSYFAYMVCDRRIWLICIYMRLNRGYHYTSKTRHLWSKPDEFSHDRIIVLWFRDQCFRALPLRHKSHVDVIVHVLHGFVKDCIIHQFV